MICKNLKDVICLFRKIRIQIIKNLIFQKLYFKNFKFFEKINKFLLRKLNQKLFKLNLKMLN